MLLVLQVAVILYSLAGVAGKFAAKQSFLSLRFLVLYALEIAILGIYALLWQQLIKRFDLSIAYANRAVALLWSMIWAALFFHETITLKNLTGIAVIILGAIIINGDCNE